MLFHGGVLVPIKDGAAPLRRKFAAQRRISAGRIHFARGCEIKFGVPARPARGADAPPAVQQKAMDEAKALNEE